MYFMNKCFLTVSYRMRVYTYKLFTSHSWGQKCENSDGECFDLTLLSIDEMLTKNESIMNEMSKERHSKKLIKNINDLPQRCNHTNVKYNHLDNLNFNLNITDDLDVK